MKDRANKSRSAARPEPLTFSSPAVGTALTILAGLSCLFLCMVLPLVGRAGSATPHYAKNLAAFSGVLLLSLFLSGLAAWSKLERRRTDGSPPPFFSLSLCAVCVVLLAALVSGLLRM